MKARSKNLSAALILAILPSFAAVIAVTFVTPPAWGDPNERAWLAARPVKHEILAWGNDGAFRRPLVMLLTSEAQWRAAMDSLALLNELTVLPAPEPPAVDWRRDAVVLVAMGEFTELHCYLDVRELRHIGRRVLCDARIDVLPSPRIQAFTSPYFIVKIGRRAEKGSAAARYEFHFLGSPTETTVAYSDADAFLKTGDVESTEPLSWGAVKALYR